MIHKKEIILKQISMFEIYIYIIQKIKLEEMIIKKLQIKEELKIQN
jgi:hypothetical protein